MQFNKLLSLRKHSILVKCKRLDISLCDSLIKRYKETVGLAKRECLDKFAKFHKYNNLKISNNLLETLCQVFKFHKVSTKYSK